MVVNITGFQQARRRAAEKARLEELRNVKVDVNNDINNDINNDELVAAMTIEEVRKELTERGVSFQPNTGEAKLKAKLVGVLNGAK